MVEEWRDVPGIPFLQVSDLGRVKSMARVREGVRNGKPYRSAWPETILAPSLTENGYWHTAIMVAGKRRKHLVHRLIGMAFIEGYTAGMTINHVNGDKKDNRLANLEWASLAENSAHAWRTGLVNLRGENQPTSKLTYKQVRIIREFLRNGVSCYKLATLCGVSDSLIAMIRDGKRWNGVH